MRQRSAHDHVLGVCGAADGGGARDPGHAAGAWPRQGRRFSIARRLQPDGISRSVCRTRRGPGCRHDRPRPVGGGPQRSATRVAGGCRRHRGQRGPARRTIEGGSHRRGGRGAAYFRIGLFDVGQSARAGTGKGDRGAGSAARIVARADRSHGCEPGAAAGGEPGRCRRLGDAGAHLWRTRAL